MTEYGTDTLLDFEWCTAQVYNRCILTKWVKIWSLFEFENKKELRHSVTKKNAIYPKFERFF